ncbi:pyridoxamine 5'-phosphate oxidase family protein [Jatrophihabitans sp. DSM 45814]
MSRSTPTRTLQKFPGEDSSALQALIAEMPIAHVAFVIDHQPYVLPIAVAIEAGPNPSEPPTILLHGSSGSRWLRSVADGRQVSVGVTALDGLVVARSAFESSMHYRSAVLFGTCSPVPATEQLSALDTLTDALIPGRVSEVRRPHRKEIAATLVLKMTVEDWSFKVSDAWPEDPPEDVATDTWAGVLPRTAKYGRAEPAPDLAEHVQLPPSVSRILNR